MPNFEFMRDPTTLRTTANFCKISDFVVNRKLRFTVHFAIVFF